MSWGALPKCSLSKGGEATLAVRLWRSPVQAYYKPGVCPTLSWVDGPMRNHRLTDCRGRGADVAYWDPLIRRYGCPTEHVT
jgi:hypothetical protein